MQWEQERGERQREWERERSGSVVRPGTGAGDGNGGYASSCVKNELHKNINHTSEQLKETIPRQWPSVQMVEQTLAGEHLHFCQEASVARLRGFAGSKKKGARAQTIKL